MTYSMLQTGVRDCVPTLLLQSFNPAREGSTTLIVCETKQVIASSSEVYEEY